MQISVRLILAKVLVHDTGGANRGVIFCNSSTVVRKMEPMMAKQGGDGGGGGGQRLVIV